MEQQESPRWWAVVAVMIGIFVGDRRATTHRFALSGGRIDGRDPRYGRVDGDGARRRGGVFSAAATGGGRASRSPYHADADDGSDGAGQRALRHGQQLFPTVGGASVGGDQYRRFWAIAGSIAPRLVPSDQVSRAMTIIFGGVAAASVLGVPLGTLLGDISNWRVAFGALGA